MRPGFSDSPSRKPGSGSNSALAIASGPNPRMRVMAIRVPAERLAESTRPYGLEIYMRDAGRHRCRVWVGRRLQLWHSVPFAEILVHLGSQKKTMAKIPYSDIHPAIFRGIVPKTTIPGGLRAPCSWPLPMLCVSAIRVP